MALTYVEVRGSLTIPERDDPAVRLPAEGQIEFRLSQDMQDSASNEIVSRAPAIAGFDEGGTFSVYLPANDTVTVQPADTHYDVTVRIFSPYAAAPIERTFPIVLTEAMAGAGVDLADLAPAIVGPELFTYVLRSEYEELLADMGPTILPDLAGVPDDMVLTTKAAEPLGTVWKYLTGDYIDATDPRFAGGAVEGGPAGQDNNAAIRAAMDEAIATGVMVVMLKPQTGLGYLIEDTIFIEAADAGVVIFSVGAKIIHKVSAIVPFGGGTKAVPVFMVKRGAHRVKFLGLDFRSDGDFAALEASVPGFWSYFAPIVVHNADDVVAICQFNGTETQAVLQHGGNRIVLDCEFNNHAVTIHVGYTNNPFFYDPGVSVIEPTSSPIGSHIKGRWRGYDKTVKPAILMSGCHDWTIDLEFADSNTVDNLCEIYSNDYGLQTAGAHFLTMRGRGRVRGDGVCNYGLMLNGYSTNATGYVHEFDVDVAAAIDVTGNGVNLERASRAYVHGKVNATGQFLRTARECDHIKVKGQYRSTGMPAGGGAWNCASVLSLDHADLSGLDVYVGGATSLIAAPGGGTQTFRNADLAKWKVFWDSEAANPIPVQIVADKKLDLSGWEVKVDSATMANRAFVVLTGTADVVMNDHRIIESNVQLAQYEITCRSLRGRGVVIPGYTVTADPGADVVMEGDFKRSTSAGGTGPTAKATNARRWVHDGHTESPVALASPVVQGVNTLSLVKGRYVCNTTVLPFRQDGGEMRRDIDQLVQNGAGGTAVTKTAGASASDPAVRVAL